MIEACGKCVGQHLQHEMDACKPSPYSISPQSFCICIIITRRSALRWPAKCSFSIVALCGRMPGNVLIGNAETISACWTPFRHRGLYLWGVVCPLGALSLPDEKKDDSADTRPTGAWETDHRRLPWPANLTQLYQQSTSPCAQAYKSPHFGLVILHRYTNSLPAPRSCLFSRPDEPRSSALIGCWNVEKALPAPRHSCLHYNLFVFQFSLRY